MVVIAAGGVAVVQVARQTAAHLAVAVPPLSVADAAAGLGPPSG